MYNRLKELAISDNGFVFDPFSGATFTTNQVGLAIIRSLQQELERAALIALLRERFDCSEADVERDLSEFFLLLRQHGLVEKEAQL